MCRRVFESIVPGIWENVARGDVRIEFREFPLIPGESDLLLHESAQCAGLQHLYLPFVKQIHLRSARTEFRRAPQEFVAETAVRTGLNLALFQRCIEKKATQERVLHDRAEGLERGVAGTPSFFINGALVDGVRRAEDLRQLIARVLKVEKERRKGAGRQRGSN
jgi:protein-disulfide isomerase